MNERKAKLVLQVGREESSLSFFVDDDVNVMMVVVVVVNADLRTAYV